MNFQDNATRKTGAISYLLYTSFGDEHQQHRPAREIRQRQAGLFPADRAQVEQRRLRQRDLQDRGVPRHGRLGQRRPELLHSHQRRNDGIAIDKSLRDQAELERRRVQGRLSGACRLAARLRLRLAGSARCRGGGARGRRRRSRRSAGWTAARPAAPTARRRPAPVVLSRNGKDFT